MRQRKEIAIGAGTLIIESGHLAKQANGACAVRYGDTVVLATACMDARGRRPRRLPAADRRLPGVHLRRRPHPGRLLQARRASHREGDPHLPPDRPPAAPAVPRGLHGTRRRSSPSCLSADGENDPDILAINGASTALVALRHPVPQPDRRGARGADRRPDRHQPHQQPARRLRPRPGRGRHRRGGGDGGGGRPPGLRGARSSSASSRGHAGDPEDHRARSTSCSATRQPREARRGRRPRLHPRSVYERGRRATSTRRCKAALFTTEASSSARPRSRPSSSPTSSRSPEDEARRRCSVKKVVSRLEEEILREVVLDERTPLRRPRPRRDPADHHRGRPAAAHPRLGALHPRRDAGAGHRRPSAPPRRADDRGVRGRERADVHAALQLPALLGRRGEVPARPRPPRDRPRRAGPPRAAADAAAEDEFPYTDPRRLRHPGVQRLLVDGHGLRRLARPVRRRRADAGAGGRRGHGPDQGATTSSPCSPTSPARKTTTATWTSRWPAPARASPRCRWTSRSPASPARS